MQSFADALVKNFMDNGGDIMFSCLAKKILTKNKKVNGLILENGEKLKTEFVISNCDAIQTFLELEYRRRNQALGTSCQNEPCGRRWKVPVQ